MERIMAHQVLPNGSITYKVKWVDCDENESTWEPAGNMANPAAVKLLKTYNQITGITKTKPRETEVVRKKKDDKPKTQASRVEIRGVYTTTRGVVKYKCKITDKFHNITRPDKTQVEVLKMTDGKRALASFQRKQARALPPASPPASLPSASPPASPSASRAKEIIPLLQESDDEGSVDIHDDVLDVDDDADEKIVIFDKFVCGDQEFYHILYANASSDVAVSVSAALLQHPDEVAAFEKAQLVSPVHGVCGCVDCARLRITVRSSTDSVAHLFEDDDPDMPLDEVERAVHANLDEGEAQARESEFTDYGAVAGATLESERPVTPLATEHDIALSDEDQALLREQAQQRQLVDIEAAVQVESEVSVAESPKLEHAKSQTELTGPIVLDADSQSTSSAAVIRIQPRRQRLKRRTTEVEGSSAKKTREEINTTTLFDTLRILADFNEPNYHTTEIDLLENLIVALLTKNLQTKSWATLSEDTLRNMDSGPLRGMNLLRALIELMSKFELSALPDFISACIVRDTDDAMADDLTSPFSDVKNIAMHITESREFTDQARCKLFEGNFGVLQNASLEAKTWFYMMTFPREYEVMDVIRDALQDIGKFAGFRSAAVDRKDFKLIITLCSIQPPAFKERLNPFEMRAMCIKVRDDEGSDAASRAAATYILTL